MTALQTQNDPAATAIAPGLGSIHTPSQDQKMNTTMNITSPDEAPARTRRSYEAVATAMRGLESEVRELMHMSDIAANAFEDVGVKLESDEYSVTFRYTHHAIDQFSFLINDVAGRAHVLLKHFEAAYRGEDAT